MLKFTKLCKYAPSLVADPRNHINKFILGVSDLVKMECNGNACQRDGYFSAYNSCRTNKE